MTNQLSSKARPWRTFSLTIFACLASSALMSVACSSGTTSDDMADGSTGGSAPGAGGSGAGGSAPGAGGSGACDVPKILNAKCGSSICHGTATDLTTVPKGSVNLLAPGVEGRIYNVNATYANIDPAENMDCPTATPEKLVDPAGIQTSLMYTKVNGGHACGATMPNLPGITLTPEQTTCFNDWLAGIIASPPQ